MKRLNNRSLRRQGQTGETIKREGTRNTRGKTGHRYNKSKYNKKDKKEYFSCDSAWWKHQ
jgi:hypothetical protein